MMSTLAIITRFFILLFIMLFSYLKLAFSHFKWVLEFLLYHPFYSLSFHHHQPLQEFQIFTEEENEQQQQVEIWHPHGEEEQVDCAVCLSKIGEGDEIRGLRCKHVFHRDCLNQWVRLMNYGCPLCGDFLGSRGRVFNDEGRQVHVIFFKFSSLGILNVTTGGSGESWDKQRA